MNSIVLDTPCGKLEGTINDGVRKFLGIRYATAGRWEYPKEVMKWCGILSANQYGSAPIQDRAFSTEWQQSFYGKEFWAGPDTTYNEDCLFLNIWTPEKPNNCPVLVVVYGGGLVAGQADEKEFDGSEYAKRGIIVVTFNYRVNIFGLFASKEIEHAEGKSGNYALYDQLTAFKWIQHNITAFGGSPDNMTLIGQSAGASSVETQIKAKINQGVFKNAIIQSSAGFVTGLPSWMKPKKKNIYEAWEKVYRASGCASIDEFRQMPAEQVFQLWHKNNKGLVYSSTITDDVFTDEDILRPSNVNVLCGITSEDTAPVVFYWLTKRFAKKQQGHAPVYAYLFSRQLPGDTYGAWHASDLWYTYNTLGSSWRPFTEEDKALSEKMIDYFASFIKTGNPNGVGQEAWLPLTAGSTTFMNFDINDCGNIRPNWFDLLKTTVTYKGPRS